MSATTLLRRKPVRKRVEIWERSLTRQRPLEAQVTERRNHWHNERITVWSPNFSSGLIWRWGPLPVCRTALKSMLEKIKPKTLVSIYCTQESIFSAPVFKDEVRAMELSMYLLQTSTWACKNVVDCLHWGKKWMVMWQLQCQSPVPLLLLVVELVALVLLQLPALEWRAILRCCDSNSPRRLVKQQE